MRKTTFFIIFLAQIVPLVASTQTSCLNLFSDLRAGQSDIGVVQLQQYLFNNGYLSNQPTGYFGNLTTQAVKNFQIARGISPTGYVGPITRESLRTTTCTDAPMEPTVSATTPVVSSLPPATRSQTKSLMRLCTAAGTDCQATLDGYSTNAIFRSKMDTLLQKYESKVTTKKQQQSNCDALMEAYAPLIAGMNPSASLHAQQQVMALCTGTPAPNESAYQLSQLRSQIEQLQETTNLLQSQQSWDQSLKLLNEPTPTPILKCKTEPWWDAGILRFKTNCQP